MQIENMQEVIRTLQKNRPAIEQGQGDSWGATFKRMLNFGQNEDNDANNSPAAALPQNPNNVEPNGSNANFQVPAGNVNGNELRRRHTAPYPVRNPPYPTNFGRSFVEAVGDHTNRHYEEVPRTPKLQKSSNAMANLGTGR